MQQQNIEQNVEQNAKTQRAQISEYIAIDKQKRMLTHITAVKESRKYNCRVSRTADEVK